MKKHILLLSIILGTAISYSVAQVKPEKKIVLNTPVVQTAPPVKKKPMILSSQTVKMKQPLKITSHVDGQDAYGAIQILGTGEPGLEITVSLYGFAEVKPKQGRSVWETFKMITIPTSTYSEVSKALKQNMGTQIKEKYYNSYKVTIDQNGKWYIPVFQSIGSVDWMRNLFIPFAWVVSAFATNPNYREGNYTSIRLGCKINAN